MRLIVPEEGEDLGRHYNIYLLKLVVVAKVFQYSFCNKDCAKHFTSIFSLNFHNSIKRMFQLESFIQNKIMSNYKWLKLRILFYSHNHKYGIRWMSPILVQLLKGLGIWLASLQFCLISTGNCKIAAIAPRSHLHIAC